MKHVRHASLRILHLSVLALVSASVIGQAAWCGEDETPTSQLLAIDPELEDEAFEPLVELAAIRDALTTLDSELLADTALQLAEGERLLLREHRAIQSGALMNVAIRIAAENRDRATLERLLRFAELQRDEETADQIRGALKLADAPRRTSEGPSIPRGQVSPEAMVLFVTFVKEIRMCRAIGDRQGLANCQVTVAQLTELHPRQRQYLDVLVSQSIAALAPPAGRSNFAFAKLTSTGRISNRPTAASGSRTNPQ